MTKVRTACDVLGRAARFLLATWQSHDILAVRPCSKPAARRHDLDAVNVNSTYSGRRQILPAQVDH